MNAQERRSTLTLAALFSCRLLGLFMVLPVFMIDAIQLPGATTHLVGLALGIYGLMQALLQIPGGMLSDLIGRKPVITAGFALFVLGSCVAAFSHTIVGVIVGRALQGSGAVGSTMMALLADLTSSQFRTQAMAVVGMVMGLSFAAAMVMGPIVQGAYGWPGLFLVMAALGILAIILLWTTVPNPPSTRVFHYDMQCSPRFCLSLLSHPRLRSLNGGIMLLHTILTASFMVIPIILNDHLHIHTHQQWALYAPVLLLSFILMFPAMLTAEKKQAIKPTFLAAIVTLLVSEYLLDHAHQSIGCVSIALSLFFTAFNFLEAVLPSMVSKVAPAAYKGTAMGMYSTSQFLGIFLGGTLGGWVQHGHGIHGVLLLCMSLTVLWLLWACYMPKLTLSSHLSLPVASAQSSQYYQNLKDLLLQQKGVYTATIQDNGIAYLKIDTTIVDMPKLRALVQHPSTVEAFEHER